MGYARNALIIFLIIFIFVILIAVIIIGLTNSRSVKSQSGIPSELLGPCGSAGTCATGLSCDFPTQTCRVPLGGPCNNFGDCLSGNYCSGVCVTGPSGGLRQPCPCSGGLVCGVDTDAPPALVCLGPQDYPCTSNDQCLSNKCESGHCKDLLKDGDPCVANDNCESGNCSLNFCQASGVTTGDIGSICDKGAPCDSGSICFGVVCTAATGGLSLPCSQTNLCTGPMDCLSATDGDPCTPSNCGATAYSCEFLINNQASPVTCGVSGVCIEGQTCVNGTCLNLFSYGCNQDGACVSQTCSTNSGLISQLTFDQVSPIGSTSFEWSPLYSTPTGATINRVFSLTVGNVETLYIVSSTGLYQRTSTTWNLAAPFTLNQMGLPQGQLIDAAGNGTTLLTVYDQGSNRTVYQVDLNNFNLTPYNNQPLPGLPGTQYDTNNTAINIGSIDLDQDLNVVLGDNSNQKAYSKKSSDTRYTKIKETDDSSVTNNDIQGVKPRFYRSNLNPKFSDLINVAYITDLEADGCHVGNVVVFNGTIRGKTSSRNYYPNYQYPNCVKFNTTDYALYSPITGIETGSGIFISQDDITNSYFAYTMTSGVADVIPSWVNPSSFVWTSPSGYYLYQSGICN